MISVEQTQTIHLGRTGEQDVTEIVFNIAPWIAQFGQGNVLLNVKRACDTIPYPANIVVVGNTAIWTVSKKDVESYGTGKAELTYLVDGQIKKSVLYKTYTEKSLADITPTPENGDSWLDAMTKQVLKAEGHSTQSESYAHGNTGARVDENTDNAKFYSEQADLDAQTTDADRQVVEQAKTEVLESAKEVGLNKQAVENVAKNVTDAEVRIGNVENDIKLMQTDVKANKDAVDLAKTEITGIQTDVTTKAQQVESDRIKVENAVVDLSKPVREHNVSPTAHEDIRTEVSKKADRTEVPTKVGDLENDSGYLTQHQDISGKADKTEIPTKISELTNDSGYLTEHQDISGKVDKVVQQKKDAEQDEQITQNKTDILANAVKPEVKGNPLVLSDSSDNMVLGLEITGSISQVQTTGKNLINDNNGFKDVDITGDGVLRRGIIFDAISGDYTVSVPIKTSNIYCKKVENGIYSSAHDFKSNSKITYNFKSKGLIIIYSTRDIDLINKNIQLEKGTEATPYEPYTGGKPSPSPEYPQEMVNGVIDSIGCNGKNLFGEENVFPSIKENTVLKNGVPCLKFVDGNLSYGRGFKTTIKFKEKTAYTFTTRVYRDNNEVCGFYIYYNDGTRDELSFQKESIGTIKSITSNPNKTVTRIASSFTYDKPLYIDLTATQLEVANNPSLYEPYKGFTSSIAPIELSKWDKIKKIDGVWKKECNTAIKVFDGSEDENWKSANDGQQDSLFYIGLPKNIISADLFCNCLKQTSVNVGGAVIIGFLVLNIKTSPLIRVRLFEGQTLLEFKEYINKNPLICYWHSTPIYEVLPQETQDVLNKIQTFYPNSTIQTNDGIELNLKYIADTKNYVDNKIAEKVAELNKNIASTQALALER